MKVNAYFTVEAAFIISGFVLIIAQFIKLDFYLHDCLLLNSTKILADIRYENSKRYFYDAETEKISLKDLTEEPAFGENKSFLNNAENAVNRITQNYFSSSALYNEVKYSGFSADKLQISLHNHGDMIRLGESIKRLVGGL